MTVACFTVVVGRGGADSIYFINYWTVKSIISHISEADRVFCK